MTGRRPKPPIVAGVDGSASSLVAVEWAADEAVWRGCGLLMVHAFSGSAIHEPPAAPVGRARAEIAFKVATERLAARGYRNLRVDTLAAQGAPRRVLRRIAEESEMLVVGREHTGRFAELLLVSTSIPAAAMAAGSPVTVVPLTWSPAARQVPPTVVLGTDGSLRSGAAAEHAFATAALLGARLMAVTAVDLPAGYPQGWPMGDGKHYLVEDARKVQAAVVDPLRAAYPEVEVELVIDERSPVEALGHYGAGADRVVIGGRGHGLLGAVLVGSVARDVLRHMTSPVTVVHDAQVRADDRP